MTKATQEANCERILIVDDEALVRNLLRRSLVDEGYQCQEAGNAKQALDSLGENEIALVILDIKMPGKSGIELLPEIKADYPDTAVIMATAVTDTHTAIQCMKEGAYDYLTKPFNPDEVIFTVDQALKKRRMELENREYHENLEQVVAQRGAELRLAIEKIKYASLDTIHRLALAAEYRDKNTGAHTKRMSQYCASIARKMGFSDPEVQNILYAAPLHDVGKIGIPDRILLKPGKLTPGAREIMKQHTVIGAQILTGSDVEFIKLAEMIALTHHERWDGRGYPLGIDESNIPLLGRIAGIADVFDALTSKRPYKLPYSVEESFNIIRGGSGTHFDPDVVDAFFAVKDEILAIKDGYKDGQESQLIRVDGRVV